MDLNSFFLAIIAFCMIVVTVFLVVFLLGVLRVLNSMNEKVAVVTFELAHILPNLRQSAKNIESATSLFGILNIFKSKKDSK